MMRTLRPWRISWRAIGTTSALATATLVTLCGPSGDAAPTRVLAAQAQAPTPPTTQAQARYTNPVIPGDFPDPSIIRVGDTYWATATTSQWAPIFPLLTSKDLVNWTQVGSVFAKPPEWSAGSYWAPEIAEDQGRFFVYYTARKKGGPLCVAAATATSPGGPYTDRGPLVCQEVGSIDAVAIADEKGTRYLVWKEDGNSRKRPTPLWAQPLAADGASLIGEPREILRNEASWEAHLIEGPFILRRDGWFYLFYSADACCGRRCNYKLGVARARALLGPWERHPKNPILAANDSWKCPGHGSLVSAPDGRTFLLYHAYDPQGFQYTGRQALLDEVTWGADGWPAINNGRGPSRDAASPAGASPRSGAWPFADEFTAPTLAPGWQWPWDREPSYQIEPARLGWLVLGASETSTTPPEESRAGASAADGTATGGTPTGGTGTGGGLPVRGAFGRGARPSVPEESGLGSVLARPTLAGDYVATTRVDSGGLPTGVRAGLVAYGDHDNAVGISITRERVMVWLREKGTERRLAEEDSPPARAYYLRLTARKGARFQFALSADGQTWRPLGPEADGGFLPPWDRSTRVALTAAGPEGTRARFDWLRIELPRD